MLAASGSQCASQEGMNKCGSGVNDGCREAQTGTRLEGHCEGLGARRLGYKLGKVEPKGRRDLEMNRDHSFVLRLHPTTAFRTLLLTMMATPFLLRDSCLQ